MKNKSKRREPIPDDAVLLIPEPEHMGDIPLFGIVPGYYNSKQMLQLVEDHKGNSGAVHFIADMLETGDPDNDGFVELLRTACKNPQEIERIVGLCRK